VGGTDTWPSVLHWLVCDGELAQVVSDHFRLDFDLVEFLKFYQHCVATKIFEVTNLARVNTNDAANHLRNYNHVSQVCPDCIWLLVWLCLLLGLSELLNQSHRLALETAVEPTACAGVDDITELFGG